MTVYEHKPWCNAMPGDAHGTNGCVCKYEWGYDKTKAWGTPECKCGIDPVCKLHDLPPKNGLIGPACKCGLNPCVCFVVITKGHPRAVKVPMFIPPPGPDGYRLERAGLKNSPDANNWIRVSSFYDESRRKKVDVLPYYDSRVTAEKIAKRMRETSWHKDVRVVPHWADPKQAPRPQTVAEVLKADGKWEILSNGKVVSQVTDKTPEANGYFSKAIENATNEMAKNAAKSMNELLAAYGVDDDMFSNSFFGKGLKLTDPPPDPATEIFQPPDIPGGKS